MASPDTSAASVLQFGINKNGGAYVDWTAASPFGSGSFSGYWRAAPVGLNLIGAIVRAFISQETVFVQFIQAATTQYWNYIGAIVEPYDADTTNSGETDNRLYGWLTNNGTAVSGSWLNASTGIFIHSTTASAAHFGVFTPSAGTLVNLGRVTTYTVAGAAAEMQTPSGVYATELFGVAKNSATNTPNSTRYGTLRGVYPIGQVQSGRYLRNGGTDLYHFISQDTTAAADGLMLPAAA
jgi:hypothetical protein